VTTLLQVYQRIVFRFPAGTRVLSHIQSDQTRNATHPASYLINTGGRSPDVKRTVTTPSNVEIKNEWSNNYTALYAFMFFADTVSHSAL